MEGNDFDRMRDLMLMGIVYPGCVEFLLLHSRSTASPAAPNMPSLSRASVRTSTEVPFFEVERATGIWEALTRVRSMSLATSPMTLRLPTTWSIGKFSGAKKLSVEPPPLRKHL